MEHQPSFADLEHEHKRKKTRREVFLAEMDQVIPWKQLITLIEPHYPKAGNGRRPYPLETMLRIHLLQHWYTGEVVDDELLRYLSPLGWEHILLTGDYIWPQTQEIKQGQFRPLRTSGEP